MYVVCSFGVSVGGGELRVSRPYLEPSHQPSFEISLKPKFSSFLYMEVISFACVVKISDRRNLLR